MILLKTNILLYMHHVEDTHAHSLTHTRLLSLLCFYQSLRGNGPHYCRFLSIRVHSLLAGKCLTTNPWLQTYVHLLN
jgi:hypothetical protein